MNELQDKIAEQTWTKFLKISDLENENDLENEKEAFKTFFEMVEKGEAQGFDKPFRRKYNTANSIISKIRKNTKPDRDMCLDFLDTLTDITENVNLENIEEDISKLASEYNYTERTNKQQTKEDLGSLSDNAKMIAGISAVALPFMMKVGAVLGGSLAFLTNTSILEGINSSMATGIVGTVITVAGVVAVAIAAGAYSNAKTSIKNLAIDNKHSDFMEEITKLAESENINVDKILAEVEKTHKRSV